MKLILKRLLLVLPVLSSTLEAKLVPTPFLTSPWVECVTRTVCEQLYRKNLFMEPHGIGAVPLTRLAQNDSVPGLLVISDRTSQELTCTFCYEKDTERGSIWYGRYGSRGAEGGKLDRPSGVAIDTVQYCGRANRVHVYVANSSPPRITRWQFDPLEHKLSRVDDIAIGLFDFPGSPTDVSCIPAATGGAYLVALSNESSQLAVLKTDSGMSVRTVLTYGERGGGTGQFSRPTGICIARDPDLPQQFLIYVSDNGNSRVARLRFDPTTEQIAWDRALCVANAWIADVTVSPFGTVYAVDWAGNRVLAFDGSITHMMYSYDGCNLVHPVEITTTGDELAICEQWTDSSGIQYLRIVPEIESLSGGCRFDATRDSAVVEFGITETQAYADIEIHSLGVHIAKDTLLLPGQRYKFAWLGRDDEGRLVLPSPNPYLVSVAAHCRVVENDSCLVVVGYQCDTVQGTCLSGTVSGTWTAALNPLVLTGDVSVGRYSSLTVQPGVCIMPSGNFGLVANGSLVLSGNSTQAVRLTPYRRLSPQADTCSPGRWQGIRVGDYAESHASLDHCIIEYAGDPGGEQDAGAAIVCRRQGGLSLTNSVVRYSSTRGFWAPYINDNEVLIRGDTFEHIADYPASVLAESVGAVVNSCTFRNNSNPALDVQVSTNHMVDQSVGWPCCEPGWRYDVDGFLRVHKPYAPSCCSLWVGTGATVRIGKDAKLEIGTSSTKTGYLGAWSQGAKIRFTSLDTLDPGNRWKGIQLSDNSWADMESCDVSYSKEDAVSVGNNALCQPWYSTFRRSQCGVHLASGNTSTLWAWVCQFVQNDTAGVKFTGNDVGNSIIQYCLFAGNSGHGLYADGAQYMQLYSNTFTGNGIPVQIRANLVYPLLCYNWVYSNAWPRIEVSTGATSGSQISDYAHWFTTPDITTYRCLDDVKVYAPSDEMPGPNATPVSDIQHQGTKTQRDANQDSDVQHDGTTTQRETRNLDFQYQDTKTRSEPNFPVKLGWQGDWYHLGIPTPMEWAKMHELRSQIVDYRLQNVESTPNFNYKGANAPEPRFGTTVPLELRNQNPPDREYPDDTKTPRHGIETSYYGPELQLDPGATVEFASSGALQVGNGSNGLGRLTAWGYPNNKITFTCFESGQYWNGIQMDSAASGSVLRHCRILRGGFASTTGCITLNKCRADIQRCEIGDANKSGTSKGINIMNAVLAIRHCTVQNCGMGVYLSVTNSNRAADVDSCAFVGNQKGVYSYRQGLSSFHNCNFTGNWPYGAYAATPTLDALSNWWGSPSGPKPFGSGDSVNSNVSYSNWRSAPVQVEPLLDAAALGPLVPSGTIVTDSLAVVVPSGTVRNNYDEPVQIPVRMRIGSYYQLDTVFWVSGGTSVPVAFRACTLAVGQYSVVLKTMLSGDQVPGNDSMVDSVNVRARVRLDAAVQRIIQPADSQYTVGCTLHFAAMVANHSDETLSFPVKLWRNDTLQEVRDTTLPGGDSAVVSDTNCIPGVGQYCFKYATCLDSDETPGNDTLSKWVWVRPVMNVVPIPPLWPSGALVSDTPIVVTPSGWVWNEYDETLAVPVRMRIGDSCVRETVVTAPKGESASVAFLPCTLTVGRRLVSLVTHLGGLVLPGDSIADSVCVREHIDVLVAQIVSPESLDYTVEDEIPFTAIVQNLHTATESVPVKLFRADTLIDSLQVIVAGHSTELAEFGNRMLRRGSYSYRFVTCLPGDENRANDTATVTFSVKSGDYWKDVAEPPVGDARFCSDEEGHVFAASRTEATVYRYDLESDEWGSIAGPPVSAVYGITAVDSAVYVLGTAGEFDFRLQNTDYRVQNQGARKATTKTKQGVRERVSKGASPNMLSAGPALWRYAAAGDSWVFVTECDSTLQLGDGTNIVGDQQGSIYLIGAGASVQQYFLAQDSWALIDGSPSIDHQGAAGLSLGRLYVVGCSTRLYRFDPNSQTWDSFARPGAVGSYNPGLGCDPHSDRLFVFWNMAGTDGRVSAKGGSRFGSSECYFELRDTGGPGSGATWCVRTPPSDSACTGAMCFAGTQNYYVSSEGFQRYRPAAMYDVAAIRAIVPDTIHAYTQFMPRVAIQNNWEDSLSFNLTLQIGSGQDSRWVTVPPQTRTPIDMNSCLLPPGHYPVTLSVSLPGGDSLPANDQWSDSIIVPLEHDAAALQLFAPQDTIQYDSLVQPYGLIANLSPDTLGIHAYFMFEECTLESCLVSVPPQMNDTVVFDTCHLPIGGHQVSIRVWISGDEEPWNDRVFNWVNVIGNQWLPRQPLNFPQPVLGDGEGTDLYAADRSQPAFSRYLIPADSWQPLPQLPMPSPCGAVSLSRVGGDIYALARSNGNGVIGCFHTATDQWDSVTVQTPIPVTDWSGLIARDSNTLYLLGPDSTSTLLRFDMAQDSWYTMSPVPAQWGPWTTCAYDDSNHIYVLADSESTVLDYTVSQDSWRVLTCLNQGDVLGAGMSFDPSRSAIELLWQGITGVTNYSEYSLSQQQWLTLGPFPCCSNRPAVAVNASRVFAAGSGTTLFAEYLRTWVDVAAEGFVGLPDTLHCDTVLSPGGVVHNAGSAPVMCNPMLTIGTTGWSAPAVYLPAGAFDTAWFGGVTCPPGWQTASLTVSCEGDQNPDNNVFSKQVFGQARLDAAVQRIIEPADSEYTVGDTLSFAVVVANRGYSTATFPVNLWRNGIQQHTWDTTLLAGDSATLYDTSRVLGAGQYCFQYATCLTGDEVPENNMQSKLVRVHPVMNAIPLPPLCPSGTLVSDTPIVVVPSGVVVNEYDESLAVPVRMRIGDNCMRETVVAVSGGGTALVAFSPCTLTIGKRLVSLVTHIGGQVLPGDSIADSVCLHEHRDVLVKQIVSPESTGYTVEDEIPFTAVIQNLLAATESVPVKLFCADTLIDSQQVVVAGLDTELVEFGSRMLRHGSYSCRFVTCLADDEDRANDTGTVGFQVKSGDYWKELAEPPVADARLCSDEEGHVFAASGTEATAYRYDLESDEWGSIAGPPVSAVFGITAVDSVVYVLGTSLQGDFRLQNTDYRVKNVGPKDGLPQSHRVSQRAQRAPGTVKGTGLQGDFRLQNTDYRVQNQGARKATTKTKQGARERVNKGASPKMLSAGPALWRYDAEGDSWCFVTECDSTLELGEGTNIVGDQQGSIYLIGAGDSVQRYFLAQDSWASIDGSPSIDHYGAASWMDGRLYAIASDCALLRFDENSGQWNTLPGPLAGASYGSALACDPAAERIFAFWDAGTAGRGFSELRDTGGTIAQAVWIERESLASETLGAAMCFGTTQGYCLDGKGGFWRYRPAAVYDVAAIRALVPDTIEANSIFAPRVEVQNNWEDSLWFNLTLQIGYNQDSRWIALPPQTRSLIDMNPCGLPPGHFPVTLTVSLPGGDSLPANDHWSDSIIVLPGPDAAAVQLFAPTGMIGFDSLVQPCGLVANQYRETLDIHAYFMIEECTLESCLVTVPPQANDTVVFDTCHLPIGGHSVSLRVWTPGDQDQSNDRVFSWVNVVGNQWLPREPLNFPQPVLGDGEGTDLYAADRGESLFSRYLIPADSWQPLPQLPGICGTVSLSCFGGDVYALARQTGSGVIGCFHSATDQWDSVTVQTPIPVTDWSGLIARDSNTLYLLGPDSTSTLLRYDKAQDTWYTLSPVPAQWGPWTTYAYDDSNHIYVLADSQGTICDYTVSQDSWRVLTGLNQGNVLGAGMSFDPSRSAIELLWQGITGVTNYSEYSLSQQQWLTLGPFPSCSNRPSVAVNSSRAFAAGSATMFAEYLRTWVDVAALDFVGLPDTFRSDTMLHPGGVVHNAGSAPVMCYPSLTIGAMAWSAPAVYLPAGASDTVWFSLLAWQGGHLTATLQVWCQGDQNPSNDCVTKQVFIHAPWESCNPPSFTSGLLDADSSSVFAAARCSDQLSEYDFTSDSWRNLTPTPFTGGCTDFGYAGGYLYALGAHGTDGLGRSKLPQAAEKSGLDAMPFAIYRLLKGDTIWQSVCESLPDSADVSGMVATQDGIFLLPQYGRRLLFLDTTNNWVERESVPVWVCVPTASGWDQGDTLYFTFMGDSGLPRFWCYSISGDTWLQRPAPPVFATRMAVEPGGSRVLLTTTSAGCAGLYQYDRSNQNWVATPGLPSQIGTWPGLCFLGAEAYLLTDLSNPPTWFWRYDPNFMQPPPEWGKLGGAAGWAEQLQQSCLTCEPNPFNKSCRITYALPRPGKACLKLYDVTGRLVMTLANGYTTAGNHVTNVSSRGLANGIYLLKLESADFKATRKLILE